MEDGDYWVIGVVNIRQVVLYSGERPATVTDISPSNPILTPQLIANP
jgi:hypothetical protein